MKLYTEEQVKEAINKAKGDWWELEYGYDNDYIINSLTPIELPSDEEVEKESIDWWAPSPFREGARWVIRQIKQQDK